MLNCSKDLFSKSIINFCFHPYCFTTLSYSLTLTFTILLDKRTLLIGNNYHTIVDMNLLIYQGTAKHCVVNLEKDI